MGTGTREQRGSEWVERKINCVQHLVITGKVITRAASVLGATYPPNPSVFSNFSTVLPVDTGHRGAGVARVSDRSPPRLGILRADGGKTAGTDKPRS